MGESLKKQNSDFLIAIYQNVQTARQSINNILQKVKDSKLRRELKSQYNDYDRIMESCEDLAKVYEIDIKDNPFLTKAKMWLQVNMATLMDKSNRKIASVTIVGTVMGIIDMISVVSDCQKCKEEIMTLATQLLEIEESNVEKLKPYLEKENNKSKDKPNAINKQEKPKT